jgi:hypothetical protein
MQADSTGAGDAVGRETVAAALAGLREGLQADGFDLAIERLTADAVELRLVAGPAACAECLLPQAELAALVQTTLAERTPLRLVDLHYPTGW